MPSAEAPASLSSNYPLIKEMMSSALGNRDNANSGTGYRCVTSDCPGLGPVS
jgi:hypothetical protein